jgi:NAD-dependent SIR2 family protein deacetylase
LDDADTLRAKVRQVVVLLKRSQNPLLYTGAGISTASGVADYASEAAGSKSVVNGMRRRKMSPWEAQPSLAHRVLAKVHAHAVAGSATADAAGEMRPFVWVQQNHDGLPQKAGFPQEWLNEIHGAWYDPSNPVVPMTGALRSDLFSWLEWLESVSDFALVLGTSLSGMNADRLVTTVGEKSLQAEPEALGAVIVSLQRTSLDHLSAVRIYATIDDFATILCEELELSVPTEQVPVVYQIRSRAKQHGSAAEMAAVVAAAANGEEQDKVGVRNGNQAWFGEDVFAVPYDATTGSRVDGWEAPTTSTTTTRLLQLDLREGSKVKLTVGVHKGDLGEVMGRDRQGHFEIIFQHKLKKTSKLTRPFMRKLGAWWVEAALEGRVEQIPLVNA